MSLDLDPIATEIEERQADQIGEQAIGQDRINEIRENDDLGSEEVLRTSGIRSEVLDAESETIGHITMIEWDRPGDVMGMIADLDQIPGISILVESSPGNYHGYNLSVEPFEEMVISSLRKSGDPLQVRWTARRGYSTLRILPKFRDHNGEQYKPAPEILRVLDSESDRPQSERHIEILRSIAVDQGSEDIARQLDAAAESHDLIGSGIKIDHYQTISDEAKHLLYNGDGGDE